MGEPVPCSFLLVVVVVVDEDDCWWLLAASVEFAVLNKGELDVAIEPVRDSDLTC